MKSAVRRILLMSALMSPNALFALGLGEIHLNSALNQPFDADIDLVSAADEDLSALRASLASGDMFTRYGLDKPAYLADFTFRVVRGANGQDVLKVTSPKPVTEPFVTLLVEANWPRGRLLREYTVLLDPPVYAPAARAAAEPVAAPRVTAAPSAPPPEPADGRAEPFAAAAPPPTPTASATTSARPSGSSVAAPSISADSTYRVRPNDTLWKIASSAHPGSRSDVNRAMVSIYQKNPQAFDGNINVLRAGSLLKIPSAADVSAISASAAAAEVSRQYRMWREGVPAAEGPDAASGRLRLVTPEQGTQAASTATTQAPAAAAQPGTASGQSQTRVQQLEAELAEARRLLELRNAELATLQAQTGATAQPGAVTPPGAAPVEAPTALETGPAVTGAEGAPAAEAPAVPAEAAPPPEPKAKPTAKPSEKEAPEAGPSLVERIADYWWLLLGLLAAALGYLFYKRSRAETGSAEVDLQEALARTTSDLRARDTTDNRGNESSIVVEERRAVEPAAAPKAPATRAPEPSRRPTAVDDTLSGEGPISIEAGDPLAEADFHMAYGLYDQAADLVQLAIKREPLRRDLRLKLLEIFFVWGNRDRFLEQAREMSASRADAQPGEWDKVLIMGKQLAPDDALFAGAQRTVTADLDMELHSSAGPLDMDLGADRGTMTDIDITSVAALAPGEAGLDFIIDEPVRGADGTSSIEPTVENPRINFGGTSDDPTQEVPIEELGIDVGDFGSLDDLSGVDGTGVMDQIIVEDTVESLRPSQHGSGQRYDQEEEADLLSATGILKEQTGILRGLAAGDVPEVDVTDDSTGVLPTIETPRLGGGKATEVDFVIGEEAATMSEVGTKLDLARAYIDMGDPEGARSILDEVLKEGSAVQKQEAERLMSSLP